MNYINRWSVSCVWVAAMIGAWFVLVPGVLSASSWIFATAGGVVFLVGGAAFFDAGRPTPSFRQSQAAAEAREAAAGRGK